MYVVILVHTEVGTYCGQGREGKKNTREKLVLGSRECLEKPEWRSSPKLYVQLDHAAHAGHYCRVPCESRLCRAH